MIMSIYYTYFLHHLPTNTFYYGVKYGKNSNPNELFKSYFSSSKYVHALIEEYGVESFTYTIRKTFDNPVKARRWEERVLRRLKVVECDVWINRHYGGTNFTTLVGDQHPSKQKWVRDKISASHKNKILTEKHKRNISKRLAGVKKTPEHNLKNSDAQKGIAKHTVSQREKWSRERMGKHRGDSNPNAKMVSYGGFTFGTINDAATHFGVCRSTMRRWLKQS